MFCFCINLSLQSCSDAGESETFDVTQELLVSMFWCISWRWGGGQQATRCVDMMFLPHRTYRVKRPHICIFALVLYKRSFQSCVSSLEATRRSRTWSGGQTLISELEKLLKQQLRRWSLFLFWSNLILDAWTPQKSYKFPFWTKSLLLKVDPKYCGWRTQDGTVEGVKAEEDQTVYNNSINRDAAPVTDRRSAHSWISFIRVSTLDYPSSAAGWQETFTAFWWEEPRGKALLK